MSKILCHWCSKLYKEKDIQVQTDEGNICKKCLDHVKDSGADLETVKELNVDPHANVDFYDKKTDMLYCTKECAKKDGSDLRNVVKWDADKKEKYNEKNSHNYCWIYLTIFW